MVAKDTATICNLCTELDGRGEGESNGIVLLGMVGYRQTHAASDINIHTKYAVSGNGELQSKKSKPRSGL